MDIKQMKNFVSQELKGLKQEHRLLSVRRFHEGRAKGCLRDLSQERSSLFTQHTVILLGLTWEEGLLHFALRSFVCLFVCFVYFYRFNGNNDYNVR